MPSASPKPARTTSVCTWSSCCRHLADGLAARHRLRRRAPPAPRPPGLLPHRPNPDHPGPTAGCHRPAAALPLGGRVRPVENVSWHADRQFCRRRARHTGRPYALPSEDPLGIRLWHRQPSTPTIPAAGPRKLAAIRCAAAGTAAPGIITTTAAPQRAASFPPQKAKSTSASALPPPVIVRFLVPGWDKRHSGARLALVGRSSRHSNIISGPQTRSVPYQLRASPSTEQSPPPSVVDTASRFLL
jgi:hypothetical protein